MLPVWLRRLIGILTLGGASVGVIAVIAGSFWTAPQPSTLLPGIVFLIAYVVGILIGTLLLEGHSASLKFAIPYWLAQIPVVSTYLVTYNFSTGASVNISMGGNTQIFYGWLLGSTFNFGMLSDVTFAIGINVVAIFIAFLLMRFSSEAL